MKESQNNEKEKISRNPFSDSRIKERWGKWEVPNELAIKTEIEYTAKDLVSETKEPFFKELSRTMIQAVLSAAYETYKDKTDISKVASDFMRADIDKLDAFFNGIEDKEKSFAYINWEKFMTSCGGLTKTVILNDVKSKFHPFVEFNSI